MSVINGHPVIAATRALRFSDHATKRNGGSGDENGNSFSFVVMWQPRKCVEKNWRMPAYAYIYHQHYTEGLCNNYLEGGF